MEKLIRAKIEQVEKLCCELGAGFVSQISTEIYKRWRETELQTQAPDGLILRFDRFTNQWIASWAEGGEFWGDTPEQATEEAIKNRGVRRRAISP